MYLVLEIGGGEARAIVLRRHKFKVSNRTEALARNTDPVSNFPIASQLTNFDEIPFKRRTALMG